MPTNSIVDRYFASVRQRDLEALCALYVNEAVLCLPDGRELQGVAAIRAMYESLFAAQAPSPTPVNIIASERAVAVELEIRLPNGAKRRTANFFTIGASGLIERLSIYARSA